MGGDYHIYLHSDKESTLASNTQPKEDSLGGAFKSKVKGDFTSEIASGGEMLSKISSTAAIVVAVAKVVDKVLTTGFEHLSNYTGQYQYSMAMNNFNTQMRNVFNPFGLAKQVIHRELEFNKQNQEIQLQSQLLGETVFSVKKVGL